MTAKVKCPAKTDEYLPWIVVDQGGECVIVRNSFRSPFGPRMYATDDRGRIRSFAEAQEAWDVAHQLNKALYNAIPTDFPRSETNWIRTRSGRKFWPLAPSPRDLDIQDIAHALAHKCRFSGHTREFYSVAQHCVLASEWSADPKWALLHDAGEAYLPDVARPVKKAVRQFDQIEERILRQVAEKYGLAWPIPDEVHRVDRNLLATEWRDLMPGAAPEWLQAEAETEPTKIRPWDPLWAKHRFLSRFIELFGDLH